MILLVRHARAGRRSEWPGDDRLRPLSKAGARQAKDLVGVLAPYVGERPLRILSSPWLRCRQTVEPLAARLGEAVEDCASLGEGRGREAVDLVRGLRGSNAVLCSHGDVIGEILEWLDRRGVDLGRHPEWPKASTWVIERGGDDLLTTRYVRPPE